MSGKRAKSRKMTRKTSPSIAGSGVKRRPPAGKAAPAPQEKKAPEKITVSNEMLKIWFRIRRAWDINKIVFRETLAMLSDKQANELYDIVKYSLYTNSYAEIVIKHPELKVLLKNDDDRFCMHDIYEYLSWRLGRQEPSPPYSRPAERMRLLRGELPEFFK